jgi:succinate dehydrogenase / fumarate reductase flavoprotein subunit
VLFRSIGPLKNGVYLDFKDAIQREGKEVIKKRYGNLFDMYKKITGMDAYETPMMISPSAHFSMGGLWVDYELMSNVEGLFVLGEANFADHGANRLGANSLLQACVDGYFIAPHTVMNYLAGIKYTSSDGLKAGQLALEQSNERINRLLKIKGSKTAEEFHKELGKILYQKCGLSREKQQLLDAREALKALQEQFYKELLVPGNKAQINFELEKAGRVEDYLGLAQLIVEDALQREESCGAHFRVEHQTVEGEAKRNDEAFKFVSVWESLPDGKFNLHKEDLEFEAIPLTERSYK